MSLLEDIVDLLRCVLEYFGVPPDMVNMIIKLNKCDYVEKQINKRDFTCSS